MSDVLEKLTSRTWPWMVGAFVIVALFMYWLYAASSSIESGLVADDTSTANIVADTAFAAEPERFARERIVLSGVLVDGVLGRAAATLDLPGRPGYPIILDRTLVDEELRLVGGDNLAIAGWVFALNDSILDVWAQRGLFDPEYRERLEGQSTFLLVDSLDFVFSGTQDSGAAEPG